jgi:Ni/Co efflux regulator RcnB
MTRRTVSVLLLASVTAATSAQQEPAPTPTLKSILLSQLKTTHNQQDWFVPASKSVVGLTAKQAAWKEGNNTNHSISQLVQHLVFWNRSQLASWKGEKGPA